MNITLRQIQAFIQVARSSNFAEAADKMHLSQPALSVSIKNLEQSLGGALFFRTTRNVKLSPEGETFFPIAVRLLTDWENAMSDMKSLFAMQRGKLTIAAMPSFASSKLAATLKPFLADAPNVNVQVVDVVMETVIQSVREGRCELGFTFETDNMEGLEFKPLFADHFIAIVPEQHRFSGLSQIAWRDLVEEPFVAMNRGSTVRAWVDEHVTRLGLEPNIAVEAGQLATLGEFVHHRLGVSVVPGICETQMKNNGLICIPISENTLIKHIGVIKQTRGNLSVAARTLWNSLLPG